MTDPNSLDARIARMEESDFEFHRARRAKQPGEWLNDRFDWSRIEQQEANERAVEADRERRAQLALERRDRLFDMPVYEPRIESLMDEERRNRECQ